MTQSSKLKQKIRDRIQRTGERYAVARQHVLNQVDTARVQRTQSAADQARSAKATGTVSEARCIEKTGHGFDYWFAILDRFKAPAAGHTAAARHLRNEHGVSAWYAQAITVSYERARGIRTVNQLCSGRFQVSASRVLPVSTEVATAALGHAKQRRLWLASIESEVAQALAGALASGRIKRGTKANTFRFRSAFGVTDARITPKADGRSTVQVSTTELADQAATEAVRAGWREVLDAFRAYVGGLS